MSGFNYTGRRYTGTCGHCGKRCYASRADARRARQEIAGGGSMRPYRCIGDSTSWHVGHLPRAVKAGAKTAAEVYRRSS